MGSFNMWGILGMVSNSGDWGWGEVYSSKQNYFSVTKIYLFGWKLEEMEICATCNSRN